MTRNIDSHSDFFFKDCSEGKQSNRAMAERAWALEFLFLGGL